MLTGRSLFPGPLLIVLGAALVRPRREIAPTSGGLVVMREFMADASPNRILTGAPLDALDASFRDGSGALQTSVELQVGPERIRMQRATYETLLLAKGALPAVHGQS